MTQKIGNAFGVRKLCFREGFAAQTEFAHSYKVTITKKMSEIRNIAIDIVKKIRDENYIALFAGGCVRDEFMGVEPEDYDIATNARPHEIMELFEKTVPVGAHFGVVLVLVNGIQFEVATFRLDGIYLNGRHPEDVTFSDSPREDAIRRDFTINGLMYDPISEKLYDYVDSVNDIEAGIIRCIGDARKRISEDKLRMIRAIRFAARFEYEIEEKTFEAIKVMAPEIIEVSWERVRDELVKIFTGKNPGTGLQLLHDTGLLRQILPEVDDMVGVPQPKKFHPEGDVFEHTKLALDYLEDPSFVFVAKPHSVPPTPFLVGRAGVGPGEELRRKLRTELAFATLLHDVGKPLTFKFADRIRFNNHDKVGAEIADRICSRLRFSNEQRKKIVHGVADHMRFMAVKEMKSSTLKRLFQRETFHLELELHRVDCLASHGSLENWEFCKREYERYAAEEKIKPEPLINGYDLIDMGYEPGHIFSKILSCVEDAQLNEEVETKEQALALVKSKFPIE